METSRDTSVDSFTEDITDGLLYLGIDSLIKIIIWVNYALFVGLTAWTDSIEFVVNFTSTSSTDWVAVALVEVPVIIIGLLHRVLLSSLGEVFGPRVAGLIDFILFVGKATRDIPVLLLSDRWVGVALNVGGVGSIEHIWGLDNLSWDHLFSSSNDDLVWDSITWSTWTSILNVDVMVAFFEISILALGFPAVGVG